MKTLIQIQDAAVAELNTTRSSPKRYQRFVCRVSIRFSKAVRALGFDDAQTAQAWRDVKDIVELNRICEEA